MKLEKTCKVLATPGGAYVMYFWTETLGEEFESVSRFLRPTDEPAVCYPRFDHWRDYRVVVHDDGRVVGIDDEDYTDRVKLTKRDIVLYKFDLKKFRNEMCASFGLKAAKEDGGQPFRSMSWGVWEPEPGATFPVTLFYARNDFKERVLERILMRNVPGEILLTPTRSSWNDEIEQLTRRNRIMLVPLLEVVQMEHGNVLPTPEWTGYLSAFYTMLGRDLPSGSRQRAEGNLFARRGEWILRFSGREVLLNGALQGPAFVRRLMMSPHREVHVGQLWKEVFGSDMGKIARMEAEGDWKAFLSSGEEVLDVAGRTDYRNRLLQLNRERAEAESKHDGARLERIDAETEAISTRLLGSVDGKGRSRKIGDEKDKLRKRISRNITFFLEKIRPTHRELADHFERSLVMGEYMVYRPPEPVEWSFE